MGWMQRYRLLLVYQMFDAMYSCCGSWQEQLIAKYLASLMNSIHSNMSSTSFQLFCEMLLLSVHQSNCEHLMFTSHGDITEVFCYVMIAFWITDFLFVKVVGNVMWILDNCNEIILLCKFCCYLLVHHYAKCTCCGNVWCSVSRIQNSITSVLLETCFKPAKMPLTCFEQVADKSATKICCRHVRDVIDLSWQAELDLAGLQHVSDFFGRLQVLSKFEAMEFRKRQTHGLCLATDQ